MGGTTDYYERLGVSRQASDDEIKSAYRRLARELHPDANGGDPASEERFKEVTLAYEVLRDPERRRRYDLFGPEGAAAGAATGGSPFDVFGGGAGGGLGDLFDAFFGGSAGGGGGRRGPVSFRGADAEVALDLAFEEAVFGVTREVSLPLPVRCEACQGSGARAGTTPTTCRQCQGAGEVRRVRQSILGQMITAAPCAACNGLGEEIASPCPECRGEGRRAEQTTYSVDVPAGVDNGSTLRLTGRGQAGMRGGPAGDLYVHLRVRRSDRFARQGYDLHHELHVAMTQAALGSSHTFETLDGPEVLAVAPGTPSGKVLRLRGRGVPHVDGRGRGDLLVTIVVDTPTGLTRGHEELLRQLAAERGELVDPPDQGLLGRIKSAFK